MAPTKKVVKKKTLKKYTPSGKTAKRRAKRTPVKKAKAKTKSKAKEQPLRGAGKSVKKMGTPDRCDWIHNQELIQEAYVKILEKTGRVPTATALAKVTEFSRDTIGKHLKKFDFSRVRRRMGMALNVALGRAMQNATSAGAHFKDIELLFKIGQEFVEKVEHGGHIDFRSYKEKLADDDGTESSGTDYDRAKKLTRLLVSEKLI